MANVMAFFTVYLCRSCVSFSSGESGSGKTEACKHILRHLTARSSPKGFALEPRMKHVSLDISPQHNRQAGQSQRIIYDSRGHLLGVPGGSDD